MYASRGESTDLEVGPEGIRHEMTVGWIVRRALFGVALIAALMGSFAWLTYSSLSAEGPDALTTSSVQTTDGR